MKLSFLLGFKILIPPFVNQKSLLDNCENYGKMLQSVLKESVKMTVQYDLGLGLHLACLRVDMSSHLPIRYLDILGFLKGKGHIIFRDIFVQGITPKECGV
jgi:hypothetical protein